MGINLKFIENINNFLLKDIKIDFTFLNIVNQKNMKERLIKRKNLNRYDKFDNKFYQNVQKGFLKNI
jgi:dTMP kinase